MAAEDQNSYDNDWEWEEYFMATALLAARRSKDPVTKVGACIVNKDNKIVGVGYNCMPKESGKFSWSEEGNNELKKKTLFVCHAEMNAILNKNSADVENCTMYVSLFPCNECAKLIIQSGIKSVIYLSDKNSNKIRTRAAKKMFRALKIEYRQYIPENEEIVIKFSEMNQNVRT